MYYIKASLASLLVLIVTSFAYSQSQVEKTLDSTLHRLKSASGTDATDTRIFDLLQSFYNEALQADNGVLSQETVQHVNNYVADTKTKNRHLLMLFLMYQQHISQTAAKGGKPNSEYQVALTKLLEKEMNAVYGKLPAIIYIYRAEALQSHGMIEEAKAMIVSALKVYPDSVPLKVYRYLDTQDEQIKKDLVQNHSGHWLVKQNGIK